MLQGNVFIQQSLELHLFFARIMKEHSFFLQMGFTQKDTNHIQEANFFRMEFDKLLADAINLSNGVVSNSVLQSNEVTTPYTLNAEIASRYFTGIDIPVSLTEAGSSLTGNSSLISNPMLERRVFELNDRSMRLIAGLAEFKKALLSDVNSCRIFTASYPLLVEHVLREAQMYYILVRRLQEREDINLEKEAYEQEAFWNRVMAEHSKFIAGLLDPTEEELQKIAFNFGKEFDQLTNESLDVMSKVAPINVITKESLEATQRIKGFKQQGTEGLINCKIKSIIIPLLGDHTLREANHFLRLLNVFSKSVAVQSVSDLIYSPKWI